MKYNFLQAIGMSFYSRDFYNEVGQNWGARAILYLLFILALCWIPSTYFMQHAINKNLPNTLTQYLDQFPPLSIKKGIAQTPENHPYFIVDPKNKKVIGIVDTSGKYKSLDATSAFFLVTSKQLSYLTKDKGIKVHQFEPTFNLEIVPQKIKQTMLEWSSWLWIFIFPFCVLFSFVWRLIQTIFYSLLGLIYGSVADLHVEYSRIWLLSLVAITPVIIIDTIVMSFGIYFPHSWVFTFALAIIYLCFAIHANKKEMQI